MLKNWVELEGEEFDALILGNGASMAVSQSFGYRSLLDHAGANGEFGKNRTLTLKPSLRDTSARWELWLQFMYSKTAQ